MTDMIERVAQAILAKDPEGAFSIHHARVYAKAAIAAMRKPTEAMLEAADAAMLHSPVIEKTDRLSTLTLGFNAMIDAALEEK